MNKVTKQFSCRNFRQTAADDKLSQNSVVKESLTTALDGKKLQDFFL